MYKGRVASILMSLLLLCVVGFIVSFMLKMTNGGTDEFKFFYVTDKDGNIYSTNDSATLSNREETKFGVKYTFLDNKGYSVKVVPSVSDENDFIYTVDENQYWFSDMLEITSAFNVVLDDDNFKLTMPDNMQAILQSIYNGQTVCVPENIDLTEISYFKLIVTSYNGNNVISIALILTIDTYTVSYLLNNTSLVSVVDTDCPLFAKSGNEVNFTVNIVEDFSAYWKISSVAYAPVGDSQSAIVLDGENGSYSFIMPKSAVQIYIIVIEISDDLFVEPDENTEYFIYYRSNAGDSSDLYLIETDIPSSVLSGDTVTFSVTIKPEYSSQYKISYVGYCKATTPWTGRFPMVWIDDTVDENGNYTFVMPNYALLFYFIISER